jgi:predicted ABC-type ATPase
MKEIKTLEEICSEYKLPKDERNEIGNKINAIMLNGKEPSEHPIAIINIAPPGSGKTGLNGYACAQFKDNNVVIINSDELKPFHPRIDELAKKYPQYYTKVTNQESNFWTDNLFDAIVANNYNVIFEGTGRNLKLLKNMMYKMHGYKIIVRGMAVDEMNCLMSIIERYEGQVKQKGWGRLVALDHFYKAYEEMLDNIQAIEQSEMADIVEVYTRGEIPSKPIRLYNSRNREFQDVRAAVIVGRQRDRKSAEQYYERSFSRRQVITKYFTEESEILDRIIEIYKRQEWIEI